MQLQIRLFVNSFLYDGWMMVKYIIAALQRNPTLSLWSEGSDAKHLKFSASVSNGRTYFCQCLKKIPVIIIVTLKKYLSSSWRPTHETQAYLDFRMNYWRIQEFRLTKISSLLIVRQKPSLYLISILIPHTTSQRHCRSYYKTLYYKQTFSGLWNSHWF